jgi:hypothetical protein
MKRVLKARRTRAVSRLKRRSVARRSRRTSFRKVVRIMGRGQFMIDTRTLKRLNEIDNSLVKMVSTDGSDDAGFRKKLTELNEVAIKHGRPVQAGEIVRSDIILPSADLPVEEAKKLFVGKGVIAL